MCNAYIAFITLQIRSAITQKHQLQKMTPYIAYQSRKERKEERRNRSKLGLEVFPARTMLECHSSLFEHLPEGWAGKLASARTKFACARIATT